MLTLHNLTQNKALSLYEPGAHGGAMLSASVERQINKGQIFSAKLSPDNCVRNDDLIQTCDCGHFEYWVVTRIESSVQSDGEKGLLITAKPIGDYELGRGGVPGNTWYDDTNIDNALLRTNALLQQQTGVSVLFNRINMPFLPLGNSYKNSHADLLLEAFFEVCINGGFRWRSRPDSREPIIDIGNFGERRQVVIAQALGQSEYDALLTRGVFPFADASYHVDWEDAVSDLFIEGGDWTGADGQQNTLLIASAVTSDGYVKKLVTYTGSTTGSQYWLLSRNSQGCKKRRFRKIKAGSILPATTGNDPPLPQQIAAAEQLLELVGENYLRLNPCEGKETFAMSLPFCMTGKFQVGDMVHFTYCRPCDEVFDDWLYVTSHSTRWDSDGTEMHNLELATVLDSLADPLSAEYGQLAPEPEFRRNVAYALTGTTNGSGQAVIPFPVTYPTAPAVVVQPVAGHTIGTSITASQVTVTLTPPTSQVTVTVVVTPP